MMSVVDIVIRIVMAIIVGGLVGYEREMRNRPAGFITHTLVCVGACVVSLIQLQMIEDTIILIANNPLLENALKVDIGRVVGQVVTGVGFLGAGTIIFHKGSIKGLTTATTIWVVACIGLAVGLGYYLISAISTVGIMFIIIFLKKLENRTRDRKYMLVYELTYRTDDEHFIENTGGFFRKNKVQVRDIKLLGKTGKAQNSCIFVVYFGVLSNRNKITEQLNDNSSIITVNKKEFHEK